MKSLERRFNNITEKNPLWGSYICFAEAVNGQRFSRQITHHWFNRLVDKEDYARDEKRGVLAHLDNLSNNVRTIGIGGKSPLQTI